MSFTGGFLTLSNGTITALGGSNLNLVTTGAGVVQVNGSVVESEGNFNALQAQVALNQSNIGAPNSNVLFPTLYTGLSSALSGSANDSVARANAGNALSGNAWDSIARTALSGSANDSTARTALSGSANDSTARTSASNAETTANLSKVFTLGGSSIAGSITYNQAFGSNITQDVWSPWTTIELKVPPGWTTGSSNSVTFNGYAYYNFDGNVTSYFAIYYNTPPTNSTFLSLIGDDTAGIGNAIPGGSAGQAYLPLKLTIPPTFLTPASEGGTINIQINGRVTTAGHQLVSNPLIDASVGLAFP